VIAHCSCGTVFWAAPPIPPCPSCAWPALVRARFETLEDFEARLDAFTQTRAQISSLPEAA
jgi:hypothetical protein